MDQRTFEQTSLWQRTLAPQDDAFESQRTRLRSSYESMRRNASILCASIQNDVPNLTLHDVNHLDALWSVADLIAGSEYPVNPAEAYIFGVSVLLHDSAHTLFAYPNGMNDLKKTPEWRDSVVATMEARDWQKVTESEIQNPPEEFVSEILFSVLRSLHAKQAEELAFLNMPSRGGKTDIFLLEDNELRNSYGALAGLVAASHHWSIEGVANGFQKRVGAISGLPAAWHIDPVKIACLLRCADAGQIDMRRAPDFLFSLLRLRGLSAEHWKAQNKLSQPIQDPDDPTALLFSSTGPFAQTDADAWWVAWDLVQVTDAELQKSNALLRNTDRPAFQLTRVRDADSVERFSMHVTTVGWTPVLADVTTTNPIKLASYLGGKELYGPEPIVPLRELIQNSSDSIRARKTLEPGEKQFQSRINVKLRKDTADSPRYWLDVQDNGVGMSERVMTGTLLDFGSSLWNSFGVEQEFPGLRGSFFKSTGKFGIGFFSVFMIADRVEVTSRRYDDGLDKARTLLFRDGLKQRPIVIEANSEAVSTSFTTNVSLRISANQEKNFLDRLLEEEPDYDEAWEAARVSLPQRVAALTPTLDCDVFVTELVNEEVKAHSESWFLEPAEGWLREISMADAQSNSKLDRALAEAAPRLELLRHDGKVVGRAAISRFAEDWYDTDFQTPIQPGLATHGGLSARPWYHKQSAPFVGAIEMIPSGAYRYLDAISGDGDYSSELVVDKKSRKAWFEAQEAHLEIGKQTAESLVGPFIHFAQLGYFSEDIILLRHYNRKSKPKELSDVTLTTFSSVLSRRSDSADELVFATSEEWIQPLMYFDEDEFTTFNKIMDEKGVSDVFFPVLEVDGINSFDLRKRSEEQGPFFKAVLHTLERSGRNFASSLDRIPKRVKPIEHVDGFLRLSFGKNDFQH